MNLLSGMLSVIDSSNLSEGKIEVEKGANENPEELQKSILQYNRAQIRVTLIDKAVDFFYLLIAAFVLVKPLDSWLVSTIPAEQNVFIRLITIILTFFLLHVVVSFPIAYYGGFVLEHKFEMSRQTFRAWLLKRIKQLILVAVIDTAYMTGLFLLITCTGIYWIPLAAGIFFILSIVFGMLLPVLILPLFYKIEPLEDKTLCDGLRRLTENTSLTLEGVYKMDLSSETVKANAMLAGLGKTRRVILGDTLLSNFSQDEIETVFAHEIGHHVHAHLWKMIPIGMAFSIIAFAICDVLIRLSSGVSLGDLANSYSLSSGFDYSSLAVWMIMPIKFFFLLIFSLYEPFSNAISRHFERQADAYALSQCGSEAYIRAFTRLGTLNKADPNPPAWEVFWFESHPPIGERIKMASLDFSRFE